MYPTVKSIKSRTAIVALGTLIALGAAISRAEEKKLDEAILKTIEFLSAEVPKWQTENDCASCHHQGEAARALIHAHHAGLVDAKPALESTIKWSSQPTQWKHNRGLAEANDPTLSNLQFALTLLDTHRFIRPEQQAIHEAALQIADLQQADGSWKLQGSGQFASPLTYGPILLTGRASNLLRASKHPQFNHHIEKAITWLRSQQPRNTLEASSLIIVNGDLDLKHPAINECLDILLKSQSEFGGVGPYAIAPDENYDTALALLAVLKLPQSETLHKFQTQAVKFLLSMQLDEGEWDGTTRPRGTESYAHRVSTTAWVLQALLAYRAHSSS